MRELVAIDIDGGPAFVDALVAVWDDGDVAFPVDRRLPPGARAALLDRARPHAVVSSAPATSDGALVRLAHEPDAPRLGSDDALVVASSGSTGSPKLIVHTHGSVRAHARAVHTRLGVDPDRDRWLACLPLNHLGGLGVVVRSLVTATGLDVWPSPDVDRLSSAPDRLGSTLVSLVPTVLDRIDAAGFRLVVLGGSGDAVVRPPHVVHTYGLTETGGGVLYDGHPLDGIDVEVASDGAISLRGPTTARGRRIADGTVVAITGPDGWIATGDLGSWSDDGRLQVAGRADDLIVTGGENVWPGPVEAVLAGHPSVGEVAVVGRPDPTWGQRVVAVVVPRDRAAPPTLGALRDLVRASMPAHAAPHQLVVVDELPRTSLGKVRRTDVAPLATSDERP